MPANRVDEETARPEGTTPKLLLDRGNPSEHLATGNAFDRTRNLSRAHVRDTLHQKVDVVQIGADLDEGDFIARRDLKADVLENVIHLSCDDRTPILARTNNVVQQKRDIMAFVDVLAHLATMVADDFDEPAYQSRRMAPQSALRQIR